MSHDLYAAWAATELARMCRVKRSILFKEDVGAYDVFANRATGRGWPIPDGGLSSEALSRKFDVAIELKRTNEGLHGVLTAIGQSQAYLHKGYSGSAIVVPSKYDTHTDPGQYITQVIQGTSAQASIGVFVYDEPDTDKTSPFENRLRCVREIGLSRTQTVQGVVAESSGRVQTQWAHLREGSSDLHVFLSYLATVRVGVRDVDLTSYPAELLVAARTLRTQADVTKALSNTVGDSPSEAAWRAFWFAYVLTPAMAIPWKRLDTGGYAVHDVESELFVNSTTRKKFFSGRSNSPKEKIVARLNAGGITVPEAWVEFAENIRARAHSLREDVDSGLLHLGLLDPDGRPSELGNRLLDAYLRSNTFEQGKVEWIFAKALLEDGGLLAFLHYFHKVSEKKFQSNPLAFGQSREGGMSFDSSAYLEHVRDVFANELRIMRTVSARGGQARKPFQAELAILRKYDLVGKFRLGLGLEINWPKIQDVLGRD